MYLQIGGNTLIELRFKELADKRDLSINKISKDTGISRPTLTTMYKGQTTGIQFDTLEKLLDYFDIDLSDFLFETAEKSALLVRPYISGIDNIYVEQNKTVPFYNSVIEAALNHDENQMDKTIAEIKEYNHKKEIPEKKDKSTLTNKPAKTYTTEDINSVYIFRYEKSNGKSIDFKAIITPIETPERENIIGMQLVLLTPREKGEKVKEFVLQLNEKNILKIIKDLALSWYQQKYFTNDIHKKSFSSLQVFVISAPGQRNILSFPVNLKRIESENKITDIKINYLQNQKPKLNTSRKINDNFYFKYLKIIGK